MSAPRLRLERLKLLAIALLMALAIGLYFIIQRGKLGDLRLATDKTLLMGLAATLVVLAIALAWVLVRNLTRILADRREGMMGSRLRTRVVFSFLLLVLAPSLFLFIGAVTIVSGTLKGLATPELEQTLRGAGKVADLVFRESSRKASRFADRLAVRISPLRGASEKAIRRELESACRDYDLAAAGYVPEQGKPVCVTRLESARRSASPAELCHLPAGLVARTMASGQGVLVEESLPTYGWRAVATRAIGESGDSRAVVWGADYLPDQLASQLARVNLTRDQIVSLRRTRPAVQRLYVVLFTLLTLLVIFAAVWTGLHLAREITDPIRDLAEGTEALATGDLDYRVDTTGDDEMAHLAASFNRMAEEIQRHREELLARQRYIETLLESVPVGVLSLSLSGAVRTFNRRTLEVLRLENLRLGTSLKESLGEGLASVASAVQPTLEGKVHRVEREVAIDVGEGTVSIQVLCGRIQISRQKEEVLVVLQDLTHLRRAERLAAWGEVARRLAHEIKNPLTPIRLAAERLLRRFRKEGTMRSETLEQGVTTIVREVEGLKGLIDEFSRFARLPELRLVSGDISSVARHAVELYGGAHPQVQLELDLEEELPPHMIDAEAIRRCLINLIENSLAAIEGEGRIVVRTRYHASHQSIVIEVIDTGSGLSEEDYQKLFLPTFSRRAGGTGLGLAIVHRIVTDHGGSIRAESTPGGGTRMVIELPAQPLTREARGE